VKYPNSICNNQNKTQADVDRVKLNHCHMTSPATQQAHGTDHPYGRNVER